VSLIVPFVATQRRFPPPWSVEVVASQKEAPLPGLKKDHSASHKFLGANAGGAGIIVRQIAVLFVHLFLLLAGLTGFLFRLLLLLLARLLPAAALLLLLVTLI
jgi:hypothetical protein